jgi:Fanconi anemia group M protein
MQLLRPGDMEIRDYQRNIAETASKKNTLVVLPTGMGKTMISVLVAVKRLEAFPESKVLITAPTRPLNAQHKKSFEDLTSIEPGEIALITGKVPPHERSDVYQKSKIVVATPQTIQNDLEDGRIKLDDFSFVTFDEAHRAMRDYAYPYIAKKYMSQSKNPLILALTASPGGSVDRVSEICDNLFIDAVEIRSEVDEDVEKYVQQIDKEFVYVDFPEELKKIRQLINEVYYEDVKWLRERHMLPHDKPNRTMLVNLQKRAGIQFSRTKNYPVLWALIRSAEAIKLSHAVEVLETQGLSFLDDYLARLADSEKKVDARILKNAKIMEAMSLIDSLRGKVEHPKMDKVREMSKKFVSENPNAKIIVFANYRMTVDKIKSALSSDGVKCEIVVGQAVKNGKGMTQDEQIETLRRFGDGEFNVLIATSVGEEGLSISNVDYIIFYESVPSEIRAIQRRGRTGRTAPGKVIFIITKDTRDEAYFFASMNKEKKMKKILYKMKERGVVKRKKSLLDFVR